MNSTCSAVWPSIGRFASSCVVMTCPTDAFTVSSGAASAVIVTESVISPTESTIFWATRTSVPMTIPVCKYFLKPFTSAVSS